MANRILASLAAAAAFVSLPVSASAQDDVSPVPELGCDALVETGEGVSKVAGVEFAVLRRDWDDDPLPELPAGAVVRCVRAAVLPDSNDWLVLQAGHPLYIVEDEGDEPRIGALEVSGGQFRFRMARGVLNDTEREQLAERLRFFQGLGPGGAARTQVHDAEARNGDLRIVQLWTDDPDAFIAAWSGPTPPRLDTTTSGSPGQVLRQFIIFDGCKPDAAGNCQLLARFEFYRPDGTRDDQDIDFVLWEGEAPPKGRLSLSNSGAGVVIGDDDPLGNYEARLVVTDSVANITATSSVDLTFSKAGGSAGWPVRACWWTRRGQPLT